MMKLAANRKNLKAHAAALMGNFHNPESEEAFIHECLKGFNQTEEHASHDRRNHLIRIGCYLPTLGVEGMLLDRNGNDLSGTCSMDGVKLDCQYCNTGDSYGLTIMYVNGRLCIGDWGSLVEALS